MSKYVFEYANHNLYISTNKHKNIILLCLYTGIRIGEALALNYDEDINLENKMLLICRTLTKDRKMF